MAGRIPEHRRSASSAAGTFRRRHYRADQAGCRARRPVATAMIVADEQRGPAIAFAPSHFELPSTRWLTRASGGFV